MAEEGYGATFAFTGGGGPGFAGKIKLVDVPELERRFMNTTHLTSTGGWDEFEPSSRKGASELTINVIYDAGEVIPLDGAAGTVTLTLSDAAASTFIVDAFVIGQTLPTPDIDSDDALIITITFKTTGPVTGTGGWLS